jgi:hypothetical protein
MLIFLMIPDIIPKGNLPGIRLGISRQKAVACITEANHGGDNHELLKRANLQGIRAL